MNLALVFTVKDSSMRTVAVDMFHHFFGGTGTDFSNSTLSRKVINHESTQNYFNISKQSIINYLKRNNGSPYNATSDNTINDNLIPISPQYSTKEDVSNGLTICINDTWGNYIDIEDYHFDGLTFSGKLKYTIYDHFGLDDLDIVGENYPGSKWLVGYSRGFASWYVLQHYKNCGGRFKPFITYIEMEIPFSGSL
jgi:uncharacterized protein (TIGR03034 family)